MMQVKGTVNRIELIGWLGMDPELRFVPSGVAVCSFRVATKRYVGRTDAGERIVETDWLPVEVWDRTAELCGQYLHKGSRVRVAGHLESQSWEDKKTGERRFKLLVRAEDVLFLDAKAETQQPTDAVEDAREEVAEDLPF
ncbi:MAG: single-stranded DNA-binding protein [Roseiflexaceae bacterium]|nr:single-stranded DNA-binding protein [Roseiflexaceae bacterium]